MILRSTAARVLAAAGTLAVSAFLLDACAPGDGDGEADLIITNAAVYTLSWPEPAPGGKPAAGAPLDTARRLMPDAGAIAIRNGVITYVGDTAGVARYRGANTRVLDARGGTVIPGLVDAHVHLSNLGASLTRVNLIGVATPEEAVQKVAERAAIAQQGEWIVGYGWDEGAWAGNYPDMRLLSERVPNNPVWLTGLHTFAGWGNRLAFERAGITPETTAPEGGEIRKDVAGRPTGILLNNAVRLMEAAIPRPTAAEMDARMTAALEAVARAGYTAVSDGNTDSEMLASLSRLDSANKLPIRVSAMLSAADTALVRQWIERGPDTARAKMLRVFTVKAFYDGALGSRGALLLEDYSDTAGHRGRGGKEIGFSDTLLTRAMGRGFQIAIHAIGDAANRRTLDFFQKAFEANPGAKSGRHRIEHAQVVTPSDIPRFGGLGLIASVQPGHAIEDKAWAEQRVGFDRIIGAYAWRSLRKSGAPLLLSSDMPGSSYDPFYMLHAAISRRDTLLQPRAGWLPAEKLTTEEAVRGYTTWAAFANFTEKNAGSIAVGKWGDITVLDRDPFRIHPDSSEKLLGGRAVMTIVGGKVVHEAPGGG